MADAYKLTTDASFSRVIRYTKAADGSDIEETQGYTYSKGDYILPEWMTARDQDRAENGELDDFLDKVSRDEAEEALAGGPETGLFIPEHEAERYALLQAGHEVIEKDQVLELRSAGAEAYAEQFKNNEANTQPAAGVTEQPSFVEVSSTNESGPVLPVEASDRVSDEVVETKAVEQPPGIPVGPTLNKAEGGSSLDRISSRRQKPGTRTSRE